MLGPSLPPILVSRFLLDLQEAHQRKVICLSSNCPFDTSHDVSAGSAVFAPVLGVLSAAIDWDGRQDIECEEYSRGDAVGSGNVEDAFVEAPIPRNHSQVSLPTGATKLLATSMGPQCQTETASHYQYVALVLFKRRFSIDRSADRRARDLSRVQHARRTGAPLL